ncbi:MAG: hypothetical protein DDT19_02257 [Syntrophomonadaceae bacterium]|nr:hypothetical protein [Bacillota bacterium]
MRMDCREQRADYQLNGMRREHREARDFPREETNDGGEVEGFSVEGHRREVRCPDVVRVPWIFCQKKIRERRGICACFPELSTSSPVGFHSEEVHHAADPLSVHPELQDDEPRTVAEVTPEHGLDLLLEAPVFVRFFVLVVEMGAGNANVFGEGGFRSRNLAAQFFFWVADSFMVIAPTNSSRALFSFLSFATSSQEGAVLAPLVSQP